MLKAFHVHLQVLSLDEVELVFVGLLNVVILFVNGGHHFIVKIDPVHDKDYSYSTKIRETHSDIVIIGCRRHGVIFRLRGQTRRNERLRG
jgi:hypothetical protein